MKKLLLLLALVGCQKILGFHDTTLEPDATIDARPDSPPDAPPPPVDVGSGGDGAITVAGVTTIDDVRTPLTAEVGAGSTLLHVADVSGFNSNDEVLIIQMTGPNAGQWETRRVANTQPGQLLTASPLHQSYGQGAVQVIRVPNYTNVMITNGATLTAHAWDGMTGGVVFFRASGTVSIAMGGKLSGDAIGFTGGDGGATGSGGTGGAGGTGGFVTACPAAGCNLSAVTHGGNGGDGLELSAGLVGEPGHPIQTKCTTGAGGKGSLLGDDNGTSNAGAVGSGLVAADIGSGGTNPIMTASTPVLGGGGGGGNSGTGGRGAGGGGGGGGPISDVNGTVNPVPGGKGGDGGAGGGGGAGGTGGAGGGIVLVFAHDITLDGSVSAFGGVGGNGADGGTGGNGGDGGAAGTAAKNCSGFAINGGVGGAGAGGNGGTGGNGGGGGAGGVIELNAFAITANGSAAAVGGAAGDIGHAGAGGGGGSGYSGGIGAPGIAGTDGVVGAAGGNGQLFFSYVDACTSCNAFGMPTAVVTQL